MSLQSDRSMLFLRICRYLMGKLMIEVLKMVKTVKFIRIKGPRDAQPPGIRKIFFWGPAFENLPEGWQGGAW